MRYFGVPTCPYCKKRVNLIRTWSLKREGEYQCPRCGGISNIYLSPLIYVLAMLALFTSGVIYFFHKFVLDDITLETGLHVFIPFALFFLFSLFMVYLEKPVIKKISKAEYEKKRRIGFKEEDRPAPVQEHPQRFEEDFVPRNAHRPGPNPQPHTADQGIVNQQAFNRARQQAVIDNTHASQRINMENPRVSQPQRPVNPSTRQQRPAPHQEQPQQAAQRRTMPQSQNTPSYSGNGYAQNGAAPMQQRTAYAQRDAAAQQRAGGQRNTPRTAGQSYGAPRQNARVVGGVETPINDRNLLERYDDPAYIQRRLDDMNRSGRGENR